MDQIITRADSIALGLKQYFTAQPCKNGHVAVRYSASGTCSECISQSNSRKRSSLPVPPRTDNSAAHQALQLKKGALRFALSDLVKVKEPVEDKNARVVFETAVALCVAEYPVLADHEFRMPVLGGPVPILAFYVPVAHVQTLRDVARAFWAQRVFDMRGINAYRDQLMKKAETPIPDWADRP